jgi:hypothetical protein
VSGRACFYANGRTQQAMRTGAYSWRQGGLGLTVVTQPTLKRGTGNPQDLTAEGRVREAGPPRGLYASVGASQLCAPTFHPFLGASQFCAPTNYPFFQLEAGSQAFEQTIEMPATGSPIRVLEVPPIRRSRCPRTP